MPKNTLEPIMRKRITRAIQTVKHIMRVRNTTKIEFNN